MTPAAASLTGCTEPTTLTRMAYDNFLVDKRVVERNIAKGLVDAAELKRHIESLPDRENNCVHVTLDASGAQTGGEAVRTAEVGHAADVSDGDVSDDDVEDDDDDDEEDEVADANTDNAQQG